MAQGLTDTGSEVTAGRITEGAHSLVAAPLTRVFPEEFSVGSSQQSFGRCQTWAEGIMGCRSIILLTQTFKNRKHKAEIVMSK